MFIKKDESGIVIILVYVDDLLVTGDSLRIVKETKEKLKQVFKMKDLGELRYFLGIEFARSDQGILMHQRKYTLELISETGLSSSKPAATPMDTNKSHMEATLRIVRYVKNQPGLGVLLSSNKNTTLTAYCDSDWASCPHTRRSRIQEHGCHSFRINLDYRSDERVGSKLETTC
uniref:Reverse transcriptase Ty1/copia-type domain-containing protein n=1 Tax=Solanum lycopersicum TaxID=4081 RepID=A0A3Q7EDS5_SOLLC